MYLNVKWAPFSLDRSVNVPSSDNEIQLWVYDTKALYLKFCRKGETLISVFDL